MNMDSRTPHSAVAPLYCYRYPDPRHCSCLMQYSLEQQHIMAFRNDCTYEVFSLLSHASIDTNSEIRRTKAERRSNSEQGQRSYRPFFCFYLNASGHYRRYSFIMVFKKRIKISRFLSKNIFPWRFRQYSTVYSV